MNVQAQTTRETILDAAEAIVTEAGSARMTLESVAQRAGVSKGGLIYYFRSKHALLEAMIDRMLDRWNELRDQIYAELPESPTRFLQAEIMTFRRIHQEHQCVSAGLLAVVANQPQLLEPVRRLHRERLKHMLAQPQVFDKSALLMTVIDGFVMQDLFQVCPYDNAQREAILDALLREAQALGEAAAGASPADPPADKN